MFLGILVIILDQISEFLQFVTGNMKIFPGDYVFVRPLEPVTPGACVGQKNVCCVEHVIFQRGCV